MAASVQSKRWSLSSLDWRSIARHVVYPVIAGAALAAYQLYQSGVTKPGELATAAVIAALAGVGRFLKALATDYTANGTK